MRKILFRGKRADNGEWVEGYLLEQNTPEYHCYIVISFKAEQDNRHTDILECDIYEVIPETVGQYTGLQYTGLTDKNGKKIFEGDIVKTQEMYDKPFSQKRKSKRHIGVVEYKIRGCSNFFNPKTGNWERGEEYSAEWIVNVADYGRFSCSAWGDFYDCEVIGNIHDNPELLKGGAEE